MSAGLDPIAEVLAEVDDLVARLMAAPRDGWWRMVTDPEFRRPAVARRLLSLAVDARLRDPSLAVDLARAATRIVDTTIVDAVEARDVAELRFESWKFCSAVLRETGRYTEVETALLKAEDAARATSEPELAQASVSLSRALFCAEPDIWRPEEAAALLDRAESVFAARCDTQRRHTVRTARAVLSYRSGDLRAASEAFTALLSVTPKDHRETYLDILSNLSGVRVELLEAGSDIERAVLYLVEQNTVAGRTVQVARAQWLMGRIHAIRGEFDTAVELLLDAMTKIGDDDTRIRVGLDAIESFLLGDRHRNAYTLARELASVALTLDRREPSRRHTLTSQVLTYLREAAQREALTADLVTACARYLDRIMRQSPFEFVPPMPLIEM